MKNVIHFYLKHLNFKTSYLVLVLGLVSISLLAQKPFKKAIKSKIKLDLKKDPVCNMDMPLHLKDTIHYQNKIYGVCSSHCKAEIKKNPKKYIK